MPFAQINCFNHTDPTNHTTAVKDLPLLNNEYWDTSKKDRIIATAPTKGKNLQPTENTIYGRSELREIDPKTGKGMAALIGQYASNIIAVRQCIFDLGPEGKSIGLQWHGSSTRPLVKGQWYYDKKDDSFYLNVQLAKTFKAKEFEFILVKGVKRGQIYDLAFGFSKNTFVAAYNWKSEQPVIQTFAINADGSYSQDKGLYSKMGVYCQTSIDVDFEDMREGQGQFGLLEWNVYHGPQMDIQSIDLDTTSFWKVGEVLTLDAPERFVMPSLASTDALYTDVPADQKDALKKMAVQIEGNISRTAKKTALENLKKLEDKLGTLVEPQGRKLMLWCFDRRKELS